MLGLSTNKVWSRFAPDAPLLTSGLVSIDDDGDVTLIDQLTRLDWQPNGTGVDVQDLLLDEPAPAICAGPTSITWLTSAITSNGS